MEAGLPRHGRRGQRRQPHLLGWTGDFGDADNFVGTFFQSPQKAWGTIDKPNKEITDLLDKAEIETDTPKRETLYQEANRKIMDWLPGVPYAHSQARARLHGGA